MTKTKEFSIQTENCEMKILQRNFNEDRKIVMSEIPSFPYDGLNKSKKKKKRKDNRMMRKRKGETLRASEKK